MPKTPLKVYLEDPDLRPRLKSHAARIEKSVSEITEEMLHLYLENFARANELIAETTRASRLQATASE